VVGEAELYRDGFFNSLLGPLEHQEAYVNEDTVKNSLNTIVLAGTLEITGIILTMDGMSFLK